MKCKNLLGLTAINILIRIIRHIKFEGDCGRKNWVSLV